MKIDALKKLIKQSVKEAIQEELKDILLEAIRSPKQTVLENIQPPQKIVDGPSMSSNEKRAAYQNILGDMSSNLTSQNAPPPFNPQGSMPGGDLPQGELNLDQIMNLMNK
tara:strand:+ start:270 stop:599 length:330 start_codon:yes stop_codon:yes gene_type:complete